MIRRACWYLALVILTGAVVVWARSRRPPAVAPRGAAGLTGGIVLNERTFDLGSTPGTAGVILPDTADRSACPKGPNDVLHGNPAPR
jgi:hypothetical protein